MIVVTGEVDPSLVGAFIRRISNRPVPHGHGEYFNVERMGLPAFDRLIEYTPVTG